MNAEKNLIDSFLGFGIKDSMNLNENPAGCNDEGRHDREIESNIDDARFRRPSDPKSPAAADALKYGSAPSGVGGILENSLDQLNTNPTRSPQRYSEANDGFTGDSFTLGSLSRFNGEGENQGGSGRYPTGGAIESGSYLIHEPEDARGHLSSKDLAAGDHSHFGNNDYNNYETSLARSGSGGSGAGANRDMFGKAPETATSPRNGYPQLSQMSPRNAQAVHEAQYGAPHGAPQYQSAPQQAPDYRQQQQPQYQQGQGQNQRYAQAPPPQQQQQPQYPRGNSMPPQQRQMGMPQQDGYYGAPAPDPYGGYKPPYNKPYAQAYRPQQGYAPTMPDPYAGYGAPPNNGYGAPRYGKPMPQPMGYPRPPYGDRGMPEQDPYFRGGYAPPPPAPYGYGGYPQQQQDPYYASGAGAVNRALGRPGHSGYGNDNYGPPSYRNGGGGGGGNGGRFRNALPMADSVNLDTVDMNTIVYQVQFKKTIRNFTLRPGDLTPVQTGDFVIVQADRGEDLGVITESFALQTFLDRRYAMRAYMDEEDQNVGYILRIASPSETKLLPEKFQDEEMIFKTCENLAIHTYRLPMTVVDVEYQFDRHKITIYYDSPLRIDFRELVRDLFSSFKARIWMKKINQFHAPDIQHFAAIALATGVQFTADNN